MPGTALKQAGYIRDGVIPEDTDGLCSLLCFQHGVLHDDGLFHQVGRNLPVTVNGCTHYRCVNNRTIRQSAEKEKLYGDLNVKMQSTDLVGSANKRFPLLPLRKRSRCLPHNCVSKSCWHSWRGCSPTAWQRRTRDRAVVTTAAQVTFSQ